MTKSHFSLFDNSFQCEFSRQKLLAKVVTGLDWTEPSFSPPCFGSLTNWQLSSLIFCFHSLSLESFASFSDSDPLSASRHCSLLFRLLSRSSSLLKLSFFKMEKYILSFKTVMRPFVPARKTRTAISR